MVAGRSRARCRRKTWNSPPGKIGSSCRLDLFTSLEHVASSSLHPAPSALDLGQRGKVPSRIAGLPRTVLALLSAAGPSVSELVGRVWATLTCDRKTGRYF